VGRRERNSITRFRLAASGRLIDIKRLDVDGCSAVGVSNPADDDVDANSSRLPSDVSITTICGDGMRDVSSVGLSINRCWEFSIIKRSSSSI